jgi:hypothetical protein
VNSLPQELWDHITPDNALPFALEWKDIRSTDHWADTGDEIRPARRIVSAGYVLYVGEDPGDPGHNILVLGNHYDYEEQMWSEFTSYPLEVVRNYDRIP